MGHMVFRRTFVRLLCAAVSVLGYPAPLVADVVALYHDLSPTFSPAPASVREEHVALVAEYAGAGFTLGATFLHSSVGAPAIFQALMRGMPTIMGLSEVREDLLGQLLQPPIVSDFDNIRHLQLSSAFCSRVLDSARSLLYSSQRLQFLRILATLSPARGAPPAELSEFPLMLHVALDMVMARQGNQRGPDSLVSLSLLQTRSARTLDSPPADWVAQAHSKAMNTRYRRLLAAAHFECPLEDCRIAHYHDWFDSNGFIIKDR